MIPLLLCAQVVLAQPAAAQSVFPLPIPTRPTSFPLTQRIELDEAAIATVVAWGNNANSQATVPAGLAKVVQVSAGFNHSVALKSDGTVVAWGDSSRGKTTVPAGLRDVVQLSAGAGGLYTVALKSDGTVVAWGDNITFFSGQPILPAGLRDVVQVSAGTAHVVVLKIDGTVEEWTRGSVSGVPADLRDVVQVGAGQSHSVALKSDGTVVAWGNNDNGQTTVPADLANVVQLSVGSLHTVALKSDGTVVAWGWDLYGQTTVPAGLVDVVQVSAGQGHTVALKSDGTVVAWGNNDNGQTTVPAGLVDVVQVSAGGGHTLAVKVSQGLTGAATKRPFDPATAVNWSAGGTGWTIDTSITRDGVDSVKAQTTDGQSTYREYTVTGPAVVDFWWKVSSEQLYDTFSYSLNGTNQESISGEVDWTYRTLTLPVGTHTIRWTYTKDASDAVGQDAGWLDDFAVYPATATLRVRDGAAVLSGVTTVDFGSADLGSAGFTKALNLANEGYVPIEVQLSLPNGSAFRYEGNATALTVYLGRGESANIPISLSAATAGNKSAQMTISAPSSAVAPPSITLTGYVRGPEISLAQGVTTLTNGQTFDMGLAPRTVEFTIRNNANVGDLVISSISATGTFQITQQPATSIPPQGSTTFKVLAQSIASGDQAGSVSITSNAANLATFTIPVTSKVLLASTTGSDIASVSAFGQGGAVGWDFAPTVLPDGSTGNALKTGATPDNGQSQLRATFTEAGLLTWKWKLSAQEGFDRLGCEVSGGPFPVRYDDATNDVALLPVNGSFDIISAEISETSTHLVLKVSVNGNVLTISPGGAEYFIAIANGKNLGASSAPRPEFLLNSPVGGMTHWIETLISENGATVEARYAEFDGTSWTSSAPFSGLLVSAGPVSTLQYTISKLGLQYERGDILYFDVFSDFNSYASFRGALDALSNNKLTISQWGESYTSSLATGISRYPRGGEIASISTKSAVWRDQAVYVPANGIVKWVYQKDGSAAVGEDAGYITDVSFQPFTAPQATYETWWASFGKPIPPSPKTPMTVSGLPAILSWVGGFNPDASPDGNLYRQLFEGGQPKFRFPISKRYAGGSVSAEFSSALTNGWSGAGVRQTLHSQDTDTVIIEATPPAGAMRGFMRLNVR